MTYLVEDGLAHPLSRLISSIRAIIAKTDPIDAACYVITITAMTLFSYLVFQQPLGVYLTRINIDDSFYYYQIARNFASGSFSTVDGIHLTNGYHPLWAAILTPVFMLVQDPIVALRIVKLFELAMLAVASFLIMSSGRKAGWSSPVALTVPLALFGAPVLYQGMEASIQVLLLAGLLYSLVHVFSSAHRFASALSLSLACSLLPWARLETLAISLPTLLVVSLRAVWTKRDHRSPIWVGWLLLGFSLFIYFCYNKAVFGSAVPISGAIKNYWSSQRFAEDGGYNLAQNARRYYWTYYRTLVECAAMCGLAGAPWFWGKYRQQQYSAFHAMDAFIVILTIGHFARLGFASLFVHWTYDNQYYYVPYLVLHAVAVAYVVARVVLVVDMAGGGQSSLRAPATALAGGAALLAVGLQAHPWSLLDQWRRIGPARTWLDASYDGAEWMNRNLAANAVIGSPDSGVVGYFSRSRVINLDGLVNDTGFFAAVKQQTVEAWIHDAGITYLAAAVRTDVGDGCATIAAASAQRRPYAGSCRLLYQGLRFQQNWRGRRDDMQFRVYAFTPSKSGGIEAASAPASRVPLIRQSSIK